MNKRYLENLWGKKGPSTIHKLHYSSGFQRLEQAAKESPGKLLKNRFLDPIQGVKVSVNSLREGNGHLCIVRLFVCFLGYPDVQPSVGTTIYATPAKDGVL